MPEIGTQSGLAEINHASIYYEITGEGQPFVMIHAGVADNRQWNNEFAYFSNHFWVVRYDQRGFGKSEPVDGEFSNLSDLEALLDYLKLEAPIILMGCSMGGGLAMDYALTHPSKVKALIMVGSGPKGLDLDVPAPAKYEQLEQAYDKGNLDLVAELETEIWFDGEGRSPTQVNQTMRQLAYEMNRNALSHEAKNLGQRLPDTSFSAAERLAELNMPVLVLVGKHDTAYILAAADIMVEKIPSARKVIFADAAHLLNMDQPEEFRRIVSSFLDEVTRKG